MKYHDHQQCGAEGLFYFHVHITVTVEGSHGMDANEAGAWNPGLMQRLWWSAAYCFAFMPGLLCFTAPAVWDHYPILLALPDCWDLLLLLAFTFTCSLSWDFFRYSGPYTWSWASTSLHNPFNHGLLLQLRLCLHPLPFPVPSLSYSPHTFMPLKPVPAKWCLHVTTFGCKQKMHHSLHLELQLMCADPKEKYPNLWSSVMLIS